MFTKGGYGMKKLLFCTLTLIFLFCGTNALAVSIPFDFIDIPSPDDTINISANLSIDVVDAGGGQVQIIVNNNNPDSFITGVYFDGIDGLLTGVPAALPGEPDDLINLIEDGKLVSDPSKADVPQGTEIGFDADLAYLAVKGDGIKKKDAGIDYGESATFLFDADFEDVVAALTSGDLKVAVHVQGIGEDDGSDSYATSIPESATMLLLGAGLIGIAGLGRKKLFKR
jgi:hypothetical protein